MTTDNLEQLVKAFNSFVDNNTIQKKSQVPRVRNKSRNIALLLYRDNNDHCVAMAKVIKKWDYTYILHDKDEFNDDDLDLHGISSDELSEDEKERLKKPHYHVLIHLPGEKEPSQVAKELQIEPRFVKRVSNRNAMLCYLIHTGLYDKYQYSPDEVHSNRPSFFREALASVTTDSEKLERVISIIQNKNCYTLSFAYKIFAKEGLTQFVLRHSSLVRALIEENGRAHFADIALYTNKPALESIDDLPF